MTLIPKAQNGLFNVDLRQDYSAPASTTMVQSPITKQMHNDNLSANKETAKTEDANKARNLRATKIAHNKVKQQRKEQAGSIDAAERQRQDSIARKYGMTYKDIVYKPIFERGSWQEKNYQNMMNEINNGIVDQMTDGHLFATKKGTRRILDSKGKEAAQSYVNMTDHIPGMAFGAFAPVATAAMYSVNPTAQTIATVAGGDRDDQEKAGLYADLAMMLPFGMRRPQKFFSVADDAGEYSLKYAAKPVEPKFPKSVDQRIAEIKNGSPRPPELDDIEYYKANIMRWRNQVEKGLHVPPNKIQEYEEKLSTLERQFAQKLKTNAMQDFIADVQKHAKQTEEYEIALQKHNDFWNNLPAKYREDSELFQPQRLRKKKDYNFESRQRAFDEIYPKYKYTQNPSTLMVLDDSNIFRMPAVDPKNNYDPKKGFRYESMYHLQSESPDYGSAELPKILHPANSFYGNIDTKEYQIAKVPKGFEFNLRTMYGGPFTASNILQENTTVANFFLNDDNAITNYVKGAAQSMRDHYRKHWDFDLYDSMPGNIIIYPQSFTKGAVGAVKDEAGEIRAVPYMSLSSNGLQDNSLYHELSHIVRTPQISLEEWPTWSSKVSPEYNWEVNNRHQQFLNYIPTATPLQFDETMAALVQRNQMLQAIAKDPTYALGHWVRTSPNYMRRPTWEDANKLIDKIKSIPEAERTPAKMLEILPQSVLDNIAAALPYKSYIRDLFAHVPAPVIDDWTIRYISQAAPIAGAAGALGASDWFQSNTEN